MSKFKPKPLSPESYEAPMEPHWRVMGAAEEKRLHEVAIADHRRFRPFGPRMRRRLLRYVIGSGVGFFVLSFAFVAMRFSTCLTFAGVGLLVGGLVAILRPSQALASVIYGFSGFVAALAAGKPMLVMALTTLVFVVVGSAIGIGEDLKRIDFDD